MDAVVQGSKKHKMKVAFWKKSYSLTAGLVMIAFLFIIAFFPKLFTGFSPTDQIYGILQPPSPDHLFGTDNFGRDLFARVVYATGIDLKIGIFAMSMPFVIGSIIGLIAGYYGGIIDQILMRVLDIFMAMPYMVVVLVLVTILTPSLNNIFIAIWLVGWKEYARLIRAEVLVVKRLEYVQAAKVLGFSDLRILFVHILPNVISVAIVFAAADIVMCMIFGATLSFLGMGVSPPTPEWGAIMADGRGVLNNAPWMCYYPGIALAFSGIAFSLFGDGLSDLLRTKGK